MNSPNDVSVRQRLLECFRVVFPNTSDADLTASSANTTSSWDSVTQVTLITVVEEDFGVRLPEEQYGELTSFASLLAFLENAPA